MVLGAPRWVPGVGAALAGPWGAHPAPSSVLPTGGRGQGAALGTQMGPCHPWQDGDSSRHGLTSIKQSLLLPGLGLSIPTAGFTPAAPQAQNPSR